MSAEPSSNEENKEAPSTDTEALLLEAPIGDFSLKQALAKTEKKKGGKPVEPIFKRKPINYEIYYNLCEKFRDHHGDFQQAESHELNMEPEGALVRAKIELRDRNFKGANTRFRKANKKLILDAEARFMFACSLLGKHQEEEIAHGNLTNLGEKGRLDPKNQIEAFSEFTKSASMGHSFASTVTLKLALDGKISDCAAPLVFCTLSAFEKLEEPKDPTNNFLHLHYVPEKELLTLPTKLDLLDICHLLLLHHDSEWIKLDENEKRTLKRHYESLSKEFGNQFPHVSQEVFDKILELITKIPSFQKKLLSNQPHKACS